MKKETKPTHLEIKGAYIKRESHLGYRAYSIEIVDGKATSKPLHDAPDIQAVALAHASTYLENSI